MIRAAALALMFTPMLSAADWPAFRGPNGDGVATDPAVPKTWSATENVLWKVLVPGIGHSSPIVSGGRVFLTAFLPDTGDRVLICFDRQTGKQLWQKAVLTAPPEKMHKNNTRPPPPGGGWTPRIVTFQNGERAAARVMTSPATESGSRSSTVRVAAWILWVANLVRQVDDPERIPTETLAGLTRRPGNRSGKRRDRTGCGHSAPRCSSG